MNVRSIPANGHLVRRRMLELGLTERDVARRAGFASTAIRTIVATGKVSTSFTLAELSRLTEGLGLRWGELLDDHEARNERSTQGDAPVLIQVLNSQKKAVEPDLLARALEWDLDRLQAARNDADHILKSVGLTVHGASNGLLLQTLDDVDHVRARLDLLRDDVLGMKQSVARVLHAAYRGRPSQKEDKNAHRVYLGQLHNLGVLVDARASGGDRHSLSDDFTYCLDF